MAHGYLTRLVPSHSISSDLSLIRLSTDSRSFREIRGTQIATVSVGGQGMSLVRLLGFRTLMCGCVVGRYRELATSREVSYIEEKGGGCDVHVHRRNHTIPERVAPSLGAVASLRAS